MLNAFAVFALILGAVGVDGVISFQVTQSAHDIGVRIALGARRGNILNLVGRQCMTPAGAEILVGLLGAALLTRAMAALLFWVGAFLLVTALLASHIPARRAMRVDPLVVLRDE
jgi:ABC-type antimicrobial peptide transport system permease subunit